MTAADRARRHAADTCHWCPTPWVIAVDDQTGHTWRACNDHDQLLPPWTEQDGA